ncbi:ABC transporter substrate-binding protein [Spirillospora sp. CA-255316]
MTGDIQGWDPANQPGYQGWTAQAVYESLFRCDIQGRPQPGIAKTWTFTPDRTGVTVQIRPGMKFSDGTPVDAAAVKASQVVVLNRHLAPVAGHDPGVPDDLGWRRRVRT